MLRNYQRRIAANAVTRNTLVMLPTGSGKTLIAAELMRVLGPRAVFFVPTRLLVEQQAASIRSWTGLNVVEFMGGVRLDVASFDVLVTTPKAFLQMQEECAELAWGAFRLVAFDEVHHLLKEHPYRKLAASLRKSAISPRVIGLSASLTYAVSAPSVEASVRRLCDELGIEAIEVATEVELAADGYVGGVSAPAEVIPVPAADSDEETPIAAGRPHLMLPTFLARVASGECTAFTAALMSTVRAMEHSLASESGHAARSFRSPIDRGAPVSEWGKEAHKLASASPRLAQLEHYYEALRLLVVSWEAAADAAAEYLRMSGAEHPGSLHVWPAPVQAAVSAFWATVPRSFSRFEHLCAVLASKIESVPDFRGIVFVEQRVMTHILEHVIAGCPTLSSRLQTACVYATTAPATASLRVTRADSTARLAAFSAGKVNLLICTVVAEEGMDIPAANCVIRFDAMVHSVSYVQGRGRARAEGSSYVVLAERPDRPVSRLAEVEREQLALIREIAGEGAGARDPLRAEKDRQAQVSRERSAAGVLSSTLDDPSTALAVLNHYCAKTKGVRDETVQQVPGGCVVSLSYSSCLRVVQGRGSAPSAKLARQEAAVNLLAHIAVSVRT